MGSASFLTCLLLLMMALSLSVQGRGDGSLYDVLGVSRDASQREIRSAHRRVARQWHPDKNKSPEAQEKIMEINKAYDVLSKEESRRRYDQTGETDPTPSGSHSHTHNERFTFFHTGNGFFQFGNFGHTKPRKDTISEHYFQNVVLVESTSRLWLLYFHGDFCMRCGEVSELWDKLHEEMNSHGIGMGSVHTSRHYGIASYCSVDTVPAVVAVVKRRVFHYHGPLQARSIRNFAKETLPSWTIVELTAEAIESFIADSITRNRPRLILFSPHTQPSLPYKAIAFAKQNVADFAFLTTDKLSEKSQAILKQYNVLQRSKNLLVFKEYTHPSATLEGSEVTGDALRSVLEGLRLHLPRLTSQQVTEDTCGSDGRLCLILVVRGTQSYNDSITTAFRDMEILQKSPPISLAYIDQDKQPQFLSSFQRIKESERKCESGQDARDVLLLRRRKGFNPRYAWFSGYCGSSEDFDNLLSFTRRTSLKTTSEQAPNPLDEFAPGIVERLLDGVAEMWYRAYDYFIANSQVFSLLTMMAVMATTLCCASIIGTNQLPEEPRIRKREREVMPALNGELYQQHIVEAGRGSVAILVLTNSDVLLISDVIERHRRRRILFFWAPLNNSWLCNLLQQSNMDPKEIEIRERIYFHGDNQQHSLCALALFGAKKKFAIFPESVTTEREDFDTDQDSTESSGSIRNRTDREKEDREKEGDGGLVDSLMGSFGFEDGEGGEGERVGALRVWLERLEDGSLKRYSITNWPQWQ